MALWRQLNSAQEKEKTTLEPRKLSWEQRLLDWTAEQETLDERVKAEYERTRERLVGQFWNRYGTDAKDWAGYALAKEGKKDWLLPVPFKRLGYMGPSWEEGRSAFCIERRCFAGPNPLLYCRGTSGWDARSWERFLRLSSGLGEVRRIDDESGTMILFRLDRRAVRETFRNRGEELSVKTLGSQLFVHCGSRDFRGEFWGAPKRRKDPLGGIYKLIRMIDEKVSSIIPRAVHARIVKAAPFAVL